MIEITEKCLDARLTLLLLSLLLISLSYFKSVNFLFYFSPSYFSFFLSIQISKVVEKIHCNGTNSYGILEMFPYITFSLSLSLHIYIIHIELLDDITFPPLYFSVRIHTRIWDNHTAAIRDSLCPWQLHRLDTNMRPEYQWRHVKFPSKWWNYYRIN